MRLKASECRRIRGEWAQSPHLSTRWSGDLKVPGVRRNIAVEHQWAIRLRYDGSFLMGVERGEEPKET